MRKNGKTIMGKIQDVMGIKNGEYCSSDVNVVSLNGNSAEASAFMGEDKEPSVTYTSCPSKELKTIYLKDIIMNKNIIPDCVLGGSVTLNDLGGYVVNYGETICPAPTVKLIQSCLDGKTISIDFGEYEVYGGNVYNLSFNGGIRPGCYTIIDDSPFNSEGSVSSVQPVMGCMSCGSVTTNFEIQSCENGLTYSVATKKSLSIGSTSYLIFNDGMIPNGCYNILGMTLSTPMDSVGLVYMTYEDCQTCQSQPQPQTYTEIQSCNGGSIYSVKGLEGEIKRGIFNLTFQEGMLPNGCYNVIGITTNDPVDGISTSSNNYYDCMSCLNPTPTPTPTFGPPQTVRQIQSCENGLIYSITNNDFPYLSGGTVLNLSFVNGSILDGCYTILGYTTGQPTDTISKSSDDHGTCNNCLNPPQLNTEIESCDDGSIYSVSNLIGNNGDVRFLLFGKGMIPNGCYTILGSTGNGADDSVSSESDNYGDCITCISSQ